MIDVLDMHTHTIASGHAYSTINEMVMAAKEKGLKLLGITEHGPKMHGTCHEIYFINLKVVPRHYGELELMLGAELNIIDYNGSVDLSEDMLKKLDICVASVHPPLLVSGTVEQNTAAYVNAMKNPYIDIIGHPDDGRFQVDYEKIAKAAKETGTLIEVNNSSLNPKGYRQNAEQNNIVLLGYCKEYGVPVIMDSDAHVSYSVGNHDASRELLKRLNFPEELIVNRSTDAFKACMKHLRGKQE